MKPVSSRQDVPIWFVVLLFATIVLPILLSAAPVHAQDPAQYQVSFEVNPSGGGSTDPSSAAVYDAGSSISISATPTSGYVFSGWNASSSSITIADPSSTPTTATIDGYGTITANFSPTTTKPADTQTVVACDPSSVEVGTSTTCTATVTGESSAAGQTVSWGSTGTGTFDSIDCTLVGSPDASSDACSVTYTPTEVGSGVHTITANYVGDAAHLDSTDNFDLAAEGSTSTTTATTTTTTTPTTTTPSAARIWTDLPDYPPDGTPTIYGSGFLPNANIDVTVIRPEGTENTWNVASDASGGFTTTYALTPLVEGTFTVTATDGTNTATTTFTDATYTITFQQNGVGSDFTGTVVTIDGTPYTVSQLPQVFSWGNEKHEWLFQSPLIVTANVKQYVWTSTTGLSSAQSDNNFHAQNSGSGSITGNYKTQYYLTVASAYDTPGGQGWYDSGGTAYASLATGTVSGGSGVQYVFTGWSGGASGSGLTSNPITMNAAKTATAQWKTQWQVAFAVSPSGAGSTTPSATTFYDDGFVIDPISASPGTGYAFSSWSVATTGTITIDNPLLASTKATIHGTGTITANFNLADTTPPVITKVITGTSGAHSWYTSDVAVAWTVADPESSVVIDSGCGTQTFTTETASAVSSCSAHSAGGSSSDSVTLRIDKTGPSASLAVTAGTAGTNGWYTSDVTIHASGTDSISSPVTCTADQSLTTETTGTVFSGSCTNDAGLSTAAADLTVKLDKTGPTATLAVTVGTLGSSGWYTSDLTVSTTGSDTISDSVACTADQFQTTETTGQIFNGQCTNGAGLSTPAASLTVKLDKTAPLITVTGTNPITIEVYSSYTDAGATLTDNLDPSVTVVSSGSVNSDLVGDYTIYYDAVDAAGNHAVQESRTVHVTPRPITVTADSQTKVYGESDPVLTYKITSGSLHDGDSFTGALTRNVGENVGTYAMTQGTLALDSNYDLTFAGADLTITKANAVISVSGYTGVYDGNAHGASGTATGVKGEDLSSSLDLGSTFTNVPGDTTHWTFTGGTNYNDASGDVVIEISKADAAIVVTAYSVTYDGDPHTATGTATGAKGESLSGLVLSGTTHTNAGTYTGDAWTFTDVTGNYKDASGTVDDKIAKADALVTVSGYTGVYDADAHAATGTATGVGGVDLSGSLNLGSSFTNVPGGTAHWAFTGGTNYLDENGDVAIVISKADATIVITPYDVTYDGNPHTATGTAAGVKGESLSGLDLSGTAHTNAGDYPTDAWTFKEVAGNYKDTSGTVHDSISKADATIVVNGYTGVYDGDAHGATGTATGVKGEDLSGSLNLGDSFANVPGGTAHWTFTGGTNYDDANGDVAIVVSRADATIVVTPYDVTYDGNAHAATGSATGVKGEALYGLALSGTTHTNAGAYNGDAWTFTDVTGNYNNANGAVDDRISKADATIVVTPYDVTYDGVAHTATGTAKGVLDESLAGLDLSGTTHTNAGTYASDAWTFTDVTGNYNDDAGTVHDNIKKADALVTVSGYTGVYDAVAHGATGSATGVGGVDLSGSLILGATFTNVPGGTAHWTFTGGTNYEDESGDVAIDISKADAEITVAPYDVTYDGAAHTATGTARGVLDEDLSGLDLSSTTHTNAGTYTGDAWTFTDVTGNYKDASGTVDDKISKKALTITANSDSKTFGETYTFAGTEFTTLGLVNPPDIVTSVTLASDGAAATATVGSYDIVASDAVGTGLSNYDITYNKGTLTVDQRPTTTTITAASVQYSDPITLTATVSPMTSGDQKLTGSVEFFISDVSVGSQSIDENGVAKLSGIPNSRAAGSYKVRAVFASENSNFAGSEGTGTLSVTKESTKIEYTGDTSVFTAGPTINKAPIRLSAKLTEEADYYPGDLTLAKVTFELTPAGGGSTITVANIPVSAAGDALTTEQVPVGDYFVKVTISSGNSYWTQSEIGEGILDVVLGSNEQRVTGGGWIPDSLSANGKDNFGFTVSYNKNGAPKGNFLFMFRGKDGYNYQVKSNSWAKGGLSFTSTNTAYFTAKCTIQRIDRITGIAESLGGDYTFAVTIKDGDLMNPKTPDTFAVTIFDSSHNIWKQVGTASSQITLGGGNMVVHSK